MRFADLLALSLGALRQQKVRTVLTTLGVVFGSFVLVISLSVGQGVQRTIEREANRHVLLRKVEVWPQWRGPDEDLKAEAVEVKGAMDEDRRKRIRKALVERRMRFGGARGPRVPLNQSRLAALSAVEHVETVTPLFQQFGWALLDGRSQSVTTCSAVADNPYYRRRVVAGAFFEGPQERSAAVSEMLCYLLGVADEADVAQLVGRKLRLEFRTEPRTAGFGVYLIKPEGGEQSREESLALEKIRRQLPAALDHLNLTSQDRDVLRKGLKEPPRRPTEVQVEELTIAAVLRQLDDDERAGPWDRLNSDADVVLPLKTAEEIFFRRFHEEGQGADSATVLVDRDENVKEVARQIKEMGLGAQAPIEYIEREKFIYLLIFTTMSCVAAVALLIAALGIANTMLMSVLERTREIGIFKAVGARDSHVQLIFLIEGACIGLAGGALGLLLGWAGSIPADRWIRSMVSRDLKIDLKESLFVFPAWLTVGVVLFAVLVTTLAAVYPARRAARVNPLTALRHE
jgi:putative ABC transport system permease protein